jgi:hypothetical protein
MTPNRRRKQPAKQQSRPRPAAADFWGTTVAEETPAPIRAADDPTALVESLGPPPLPNRELMARAYFTSAYDKAAVLARALAAAGGLLAVNAEDDDDEFG